MTRWIGQSMKRREDPELLTGRATYVGDVVRPGMLHGAFVRSPYAHAAIRSVDTSRALAMPVATLRGGVAESGSRLVLRRERRAVEVPDLPGAPTTTVVPAEDRCLAKAEADDVAVALVVARRGIHDG